MGFNNVYRQLAGRIVGTSEKAIKLEYATGEQDDLGDPELAVNWFPISQLSSIHNFSKQHPEADDILMVSEWILKQKDILHLAGTTSKPVLSGVPTSIKPTIADKLAHPPVSNWSDMDDDVPF